MIAAAPDRDLTGYHGTKRRCMAGNAGPLRIAKARCKSGRLPVISLRAPPQYFPLKQ